MLYSIFLYIFLRFFIIRILIKRKKDIAKLSPIKNKQKKKTKELNQAGKYAFRNREYEISYWS